MTLKVLTIASPIMSAAAVAEVRRGLRTAFSRLSRPAVPNRRGNGRASARTTGC
jgi:hypothetical protein